MAESIDLRDIERRPLKYWNIDGLPELMMGLLWVAWGVAWLVGQTLPRGLAWNLYWMFTPALLALSGVATVWATKKLKARITFPRTGYVEWKAPSPTQRFTAAGVALVTAAVAAILIARSRANGAENLAAPATSVVLSLGFVVASLRQRAPHLLALAGAALVLGLVFAASKTGWDAMNWMFVGLGATAMLIGGFRLWRFLDRHPIQVQA